MAFANGRERASTWALISREGLRGRWIGSTAEREATGGWEETSRERKKGGWISRTALLTPERSREQAFSN
ncbi:hypothetical protein KFK09_007241 [Dendrobium nobile]|uniref:Uncharacterized protein n=1 Tax=Dendrobium nobile TaxID=94219 RepID=A0A8T3BTJ2_DENNO|nr:hypothetical protein KFK09_007241 [Dendrobium nobile]